MKRTAEEMVGRLRTLRTMVLEATTDARHSTWAERHADLIGNARGLISDAEQLLRDVRASLRAGKAPQGGAR